MDIFVVKIRYEELTGVGKDQTSCTQNCRILPYNLFKPVLQRNSILNYYPHLGFPFKNFLTIVHHTRRIIVVLQDSPLLGKSEHLGFEKVVVA